jgi:hypothetical protein
LAATDAIVISSYVQELTALGERIVPPWSVNFGMVAMVLVESLAHRHIFAARENCPPRGN